MAAQLESQQTTSNAIPQPPLQSWKRTSDQTAVKANHSLESYAPINLAEMKAVALLKRVDTKYILPTRQLFQALGNLKDQYRVLEVHGSRLNRYHNLYFDTSNFDLYHQHHNGQRDRYKVRSRQYVDTRLDYLEVKRKNNRDQTIKSRLKTSDFVSALTEKDRKFLHGKFPGEYLDLQPVLWVDYTRITLVSKRRVERLTLDINLSFSNSWDQYELPGLAVAEVKQDGFSINSDFIQQMRAMKTQSERFSKYCQGITHFYPQVKHNRFKPRTLLIERIIRQGENYGYHH
jgi:hypothetical protein